MIKEAKKASKSLGREPIFSVRDGWNLGVGLWLASFAMPFLIGFIGLIAFFLFWILALVAGYM